MHFEGGIVEGVERVVHTAFSHGAALLPSAHDAGGIATATVDRDRAVNVHGRHIGVAQRERVVATAGAQIDGFDVAQTVVGHRGEVHIAARLEAVYAIAAINEQIVGIKHHDICAIAGFQDVSTCAAIQRIAARVAAHELCASLWAVATTIGHVDHLHHVGSFVDTQNHAGIVGVGVEVVSHPTFHGGGRCCSHEAAVHKDGVAHHQGVGGGAAQAEVCHIACGGRAGEHQGVAQRASRCEPSRCMGCKVTGHCTG